MNEILLTLALLPAMAISPSYSSRKVNEAKNASSSSTLHIYNWADYIGENVLSEFHDYVLKHDNVNLDIVYETFDTNEIMLSQLETGSASYDLVCPSDYMIQRMMANDLLVPFSKDDEERKALYVHGDDASVWPNNYKTYASSYLQDVFSTISSPIGGDSSKMGTLAEYARGYMWGTLGILYNPGFSAYGNRGLSEDDVKFAMSDWNSLWDESYKGTFQIKDSMRDTYSVALMKVYDSYFKALKDQHDKGSISDSTYNKDVSTIFNNISNVDDFNKIVKSLDPTAEEVTSDTIIDSIQGYLSSLKDNSYGLEVDSGKTDITDGKMSGIGIAWSGDAVYSMDTAEKLGNTLYYSIPETGGNIWFDGWAIPKTCQNKEYAEKFIDFISDPSIAAENMDFIGYTPFIAGDAIIDTVRQWYDPRAYYIYAYDETADDYLYDDEDNPIFCSGKGKQEVSVKVGEKEETHTVDYGSVGDMTGSDYNTPIINGVSSSWADISAKEGWTSVNLSWFFSGSYSEDGDYSSDFYSSEIEEITHTYEDGSTKTVQVGRQFFAQYPPTDIIPSLCVMEDYGDNNSYVLRMWEAVKSGSIPTGVIVTLSIEAAIALTLFGFIGVRSSIAHRLRKKRREENKANS